MKRLILLIAVICGVGLIVIVGVRQKHAQINPSAAFIIPDDRLPSVTEMALRGDGGAAARLSKHFLEKRDYRLAYTWMQRADRLGYPQAKANLEAMRQFLPSDITTQGGRTPAHP
jgi:TPR repeat protein